MASKPPVTERVAIPGPAGDLQALIEIPQPWDESKPVKAFAVVCHPHPLHGGTLDNKVVYTVARAFEERGVPAIRFNFRGVGTSAGQYDEGIGETEDALAVIAYGRQRWPGAALWLGGFSFGGAVAIHAAARAHAQRLVLISPAVGRLRIPAMASLPSTTLVVQGDADDVIEPHTVLDWAQTATPAPRVSVLTGAGHFFHGRLHELRETVLAFLDAS
jgi:alpha/beta superfamily hydrolase